MPPLPSVPGVLRVALVGHIANDVNVVNRWYHTYTGPAPGAADLDNLASDVLAQWNGHIIPLQGTFYSTESCTITDLSSPTAAEGTNVGAYTGSRGGTGPDPATCAVIQHKIARRYRGGHCRTYLWCGISSDRADDQTWNSTFLLAVTTGWDGMIFALNGLTVGAATLGPQVNVSYFEGYTNVTYPSGRVRAVPSRRAVPLVDGIIGTGVNPRLGSQRRRNQQAR